MATAKSDWHQPKQPRPNPAAHTGPIPEHTGEIRTDVNAAEAAWTHLRKLPSQHHPLVGGPTRPNVLRMGKWTSLSSHSKPMANQ